MLGRETGPRERLHRLVRHERIQDANRRARNPRDRGPDHFVFPWHGRNKRLDATRPMAFWRIAWRSMRKAAGLSEVRFHDGRHTAITTLAEKGLPDSVIQAQVGHVAPEMMKTYSHIRRQALNQAADALEPTTTTTQSPQPTAPKSHAT
jgi:integrase